MALPVVGTHLLNMPRIDVHHHYFAADLNKVEGYASIGWRAPSENIPWSPELSLKAMDASGIDIAILSFPALHSGSVSLENRARTKSRNLAMAGCRDTHPTRFGFFACLPFLDDVDGMPTCAHVFMECSTIYFQVLWKRLHMPLMNSMLMVFHFLRRMEKVSTQVRSRIALVTFFTHALVLSHSIYW